MDLQKKLQYLEQFFDQAQSDLIEMIQNIVDSEKNISSETCLNMLKEKIGD